MTPYKTILNDFNEIDKNLLEQPLSIICMNIRSLRKHFIELITHINNVINKIQLLILTETNITDDENQFFQIKGFNAVFLNREGRGGGIAVYISEKLKFKNISTQTVSFESTGIDVIIENEREISVISCYRPPNQNTQTFIKGLFINLVIIFFFFIKKVEKIGFVISLIVLIGICFVLFCITDLI